jgi:hypothetical protein
MGDNKSALDAGSLCAAQPTGCVCVCVCVAYTEHLTHMHTHTRNTHTHTHTKHTRILHGKCRIMRD